MYLETVNYHKIACKHYGKNLTLTLNNNLERDKRFDVENVLEKRNENLMLAVHIRRDSFGETLVKNLG